MTERARLLSGVARAVLKKMSWIRLSFMMALFVGRDQTRFALALDE